MRNLLAIIAKKEICDNPLYVKGIAPIRNSILLFCVLDKAAFLLRKFIGRAFVG
jgi:hypothetical protein